MLSLDTIQDQLSHIEHTIRNLMFVNSPLAIPSTLILRTMYGELYEFSKTWIPQLSDILTDIIRKVKTGEIPLLTSNSLSSLHIYYNAKIKLNNAESEQHSLAITINKPNPQSVTASITGFDLDGQNIYLDKNLINDGGVFVGSGIFKSQDPRERAEAIVIATAYWDDPEVVVEAQRMVSEKASMMV